MRFAGHIFRSGGLLWLWLTCAFHLSAADPRVAARSDILILNGTLIDGTGAPARQVDIAIRGGRIQRVGQLKHAPAQVALDASGLIVCPGFIDLHSHADRGILEHRAAENYVRQGVTTLLCGNCGSSPVDVGKFFEQVDAGGTGPNIALLIGHGSLREQVMGRANRRPTTAELGRMKNMVRQAMQAGAAGLSTSLRYGPGAYAEMDEIAALTEEIAPYQGFYATHMRDEGTRILEAIEEALLIGRKADVAVHISHHKISSVSAFGLTRQTLARIERARADGRDVTLDQYPYGAGSGGVSLYAPHWSLAGGLDAFRQRIQDKRQRKSIHKSVEELLIRKLYHAGQNPADRRATHDALTRIQIARATHDPQLEG
ncbi:MAG: amidohydrolase family protein, partial [Planctomycetaceae bacterium]